MPQYTYECNDCHSLKIFDMSIVEFVKQNKEIEKAFCEECGKATLIRKFFAPSGKIERRRDEILSKAKEDAKVITNKIKEGDQSAIRDVFGERAE